MIRFSIPNIDARFSVANDVVPSFYPVWASRFEERIIAISMTRAEAEEACRIHALCVEAAEECTA